MSVELMKSLYAKLVSNDGGTPPDYNDVYDAVGGRIYALEAPPETVFPFLVYSIDPPDVEHFFGSGKRRLTTTASMTVYAKVDQGALLAMTVGDKVFTLFDQAELTATSFDRMYVRALQRGVVEYDGDELFMITNTFELTAHNT